MQRFGSDNRQRAIDRVSGSKLGVILFAILVAAPDTAHCQWGSPMPQAWTGPQRLPPVWVAPSFETPTRLDFDRYARASNEFPVPYGMSLFDSNPSGRGVSIPLPRNWPPTSAAPFVTAPYAPSPTPSNSPFTLTGAAQDQSAQNTNEENRTTQPQNNGQSTGDTQRLGEAPEDTSRSFLRAATVLLEPGHFQFDYGLNYVLFDSKDLIPVNGTVAFERVRQRQWTIPLAVRYGLTEKVQLFANTPIGAALLESSTSSGGDTTSVGGMGDVQAGFLYLLHEQDECLPDIIYGSSFTAPTGADVFHPGRVAYLGNGFWSAESHVSFIKTIEPAVLLGGLGYSHTFEADHLGQTLQPGGQITYQLGSGFAINETLTFSGIVQGSFQGPTEADGTRLPQSSLEPISLRFALTAYQSKNKIIEPFVRLGLTDDAPQAELGIVTTFSN